MLTLASANHGILEFKPNMEIETAGLEYQSSWIYESVNSRITWQSIAEDNYASFFLHYLASTDDKIIISGLPFPYTLIAVFGYPITCWLSPLVKRTIQDRGSNLFYAALLKCEIQFQKDRNYQLIFIHFSKDFMTQSLEDSARQVRSSWELQSPAFYYLKSIIIDRQERKMIFNFLSSPENKDLARAILLNLLNENQGKFQPNSISPTDAEIFYLSRDHILEMAFSKMPLSALLKKAGIYPVTSFRKRLKQLYDLSIREFLMEIRLEESVRLLRAEQMSIKEIATKTGFANASYFSRVFAHYYGEAPKYFRENTER
jgi:AraC-like DNA-binding protein